MDALWWILGTLALFWGVVIWLYLRTHDKLDDIHEETKGVRVRLERHSEDAAYDRRKDREESKRHRSQIYNMFVEFLNYMRGK